MKLSSYAAPFITQSCVKKKCEAMVVKFYWLMDAKTALRVWKTSLTRQGSMSGSPLARHHLPTPEPPGGLWAQLWDAGREQRPAP